MDNSKRNHYLFQILTFLLLIICLSGTIYYFKTKKNNTITADESSELLLGNIVASENSLISKNWYYSTELSVFNTNIIYSFFFHLSNNWHRVRVFSTVSMYFILLLAYYCMSRAYHFRKFFFLTAAVLFIPFSSDYYHYILKGAYYYPVITILIVTLAIAELYLKFSGWKSYAMLGISFILSILAGLGGARQLFYTYMPLLAASGIILILKITSSESRIRWFVFSVVSFLGNILGYAVNSKIFTRIYHFKSWNNVEFIPLDLDQIINILNGFLVSLGYSRGNIFSTVLLKNGICMVWIFLTILSIWYALKYKQKVSHEYVRLAVFIGCAYIIYTALYVFTNIAYSSRFILPITCLSLPLFALFFLQNRWKKDISAGVFSLFVLLIAVGGLKYYISEWNHDENREIRQISKFLVDQEYSNGYATFWNSNNLTEFSNGRIEVWCLCDSIYDPMGLYRVTDIDKPYPWLQKVSHDTTHPSGKIFLLLTAKEVVENNWKENLKEEKRIYQSSDYEIFGYDDYDDLINNLYSGYDFVFGDDQWIENGKDVDGHRELYVAGKSHGPYKTFWPGNYEITVQGDNFAEAETYCISEYGKTVYDLSLIGRDEQTMRYSLEIPEKAQNVEVIVRNLSDIPDSIVKIDSIRIRKCIDSECAAEEDSL